MKQLTTQIICDLLAIGSNITDFTLEENKVSIKAVTGEENDDIDYFIKLLLRKQKNERYVALITLPNGEERFKKSYPGETIKEFDDRINRIFDPKKCAIESYIIRRFILKKDED